MKRQTGRIPSPTFRAGVTLTTLVVIPPDRNGDFPADLTAGDFRVAEDGRFQEVASVVMVRAGRVANRQLVAPTPSSGGVVLSPARPSDERSGRVFVIVVDDLHIAASQTFHARDAFRRLTDTLIHEGDLVGVVSTGPSAIALGVSADHTRLAAAAERITGDGFGPDALIRNFPPDPNGSRELSWRARSAFGTMRRVVEWLDQVQDRRKVVIHFSSGYDFNPFAPERSAYFSRLEPLDPLGRPTNLGAVFADMELARDVGELAEAASQPSERLVLHRRSARTCRWPGGRPLAHERDAVVQRVGLHIPRRASLARRVDRGRAIVNRNDFDAAFREVDAETSDYYVLGFYPSNADPRRRRRELRVEVIGRGDVDVRHRSHYHVRTYGEARQRQPAIR